MLLKIKNQNGDFIDVPAIKGKDGEDGTTPVKGVDYFTETDKTEILNEIESLSNIEIENLLI